MPLVELNNKNNVSISAITKAASTKNLESKIRKHIYFIKKKYPFFSV